MTTKITPQLLRLINKLASRALSRRHRLIIANHRAQQERLRGELERAAKAPPIDEAALARLHAEGAKAWAFLGDRSASEWVDELRGNDDHVADDRKLVDEIRAIAGTGCLPDGTVLSVPVAEWFEDFARRVTLPQQRQDCEPVGTVESAAKGCGGFHVRLHPESAMPKVGEPLYTAPPKREPLSDEQIRMLPISADMGWIEIVRAVEAAHGIGGQS